MYIKKGIIKNYIYVNITMLLLSIYVIFFPVFAKLMSKISPMLTTCIYKQITGKNCPFCGGTRYIANIKEAFSNVSYLFCPFGYMIMFIIFEFLFRIFVIIRIRQIKEKNLKSIVLFDIIIHLIAVVLLFGYEIIFLINN